MYDYTFVRVVYHILNNFPKKRKVKKFQLHQIDEKPSTSSESDNWIIVKAFVGRSKSWIATSFYLLERGLEIAESNSGQFPRKGWLKAYKLWRSARQAGNSIWRFRGIRGKFVFATNFSPSLGMNLFVLFFFPLLARARG